MDEPAPLAYTYISDSSGMEDLLTGIASAGRIALDTEADSLHHYYEKVCLIQLTFNNTNYIVDPLAEVDLAPLLAILADKPLIIHGADYDLRMMRQTFGFIPRGEIFDTMLAGKMLGYQHFGLSALLLQFFGYELSKEGQKSDWSRRPLTQQQTMYACEDTRFLAPLADVLRAKLEEEGKFGWFGQSCRRIVKASQVDKKHDPDSAWRVKGYHDLSRKELAYLQQLWAWREEIAKADDVPAFKVMNNPLMLKLAQWAAGHPDSSLKAGPRLPRNCVGSKFKSLREAIASAGQIPAEDWPMRYKPRPTEYTPTDRKLVKKLQDACEQVAAANNIESSMLAPRAAIESIVRSNPQDAEQMRSCCKLADWQIGLVADVFLRAMKNHDGNNSCR